MKPKKPTKRAPKPKVYAVTFKVRTFANASLVREAVSSIASVFGTALYTKPRVEEIGTR